MIFGLFLNLGLLDAPGAAQLSREYRGISMIWHILVEGLLIRLYIRSRGYRRYLRSQAAQNNKSVAIQAAVPFAAPRPSSANNLPGALPTVTPANYRTS